MLNSLAFLWSWLAIVLVIFVGFFIQAAIALLTFPFDRRRLVAGRFFRLMAVAAARVIPTWHFGIHGAAPRRSPGRTVVVSNHVSNADVFLISFLPWEMKWLGKSSLFRLPFIGWSMWIAGDVPIHRRSKASGAKAMKDCARWLERGVPVMMFPEGTRAIDDEMLPFKDGAFRLAIEAGADVLPIAVAGTREALPKHSWRFGRSRARVVVGKPIPTAGMTLAQLEALKDRSRAEIEALLRELRSDPQVTAN